MSPDFVALREQFPSLDDRVYLMTHSFGLCSRGTFEDLEAYRETLLRRPALFNEWFDRLEEMYGLVERLLGAQPGSVALRESASACHATVLSALQPTPARSRLIASAMQFPSISYMVAAQSQRGFEVELVPSPDGIHLDAEAIASRLDRHTVAVLAPVVASFNGALLDVPRLLESAHDVGAIPILDAYSALGVVPLDVSKLPPCVVIGGTMKWLGGGGTGLAFMYVHPELIERLPVCYPAWIGDARFMEFSADYLPAPGARRYQVGTPAIEPIYTGRAGVQFVLEQGVGHLRERNRFMLEYLRRRAEELGLKSNSPSDPARYAGVIALEVDDANRVVSELRAKGIEIDTRNRGSVRLGPHWCVSIDECERAITLVAEFAHS